MAQSVGDSNIAGFGLGYEYKFDKDFGIFVEAGYGKVDYTPDRVIQDEMVYTVIVADWSQEQLDASDINCAYNNLDGTKECYQGGSDLKSSFLGRVGIGYQVWEHVKITAAYRYMRTNFDLTLTDSGSRSGNTGTTYSDTYDLNLDAFELGVMFTW
jgi:opacity protein-like surface antigen